MLQMYEAKRWFQAQGACLGPYKDFCQKTNIVGNSGVHIARWLLVVHGPPR